MTKKKSKKEVSQEKENNNENKELKGIDGWLGFFRFTLFASCVFLFYSWIIAISDEVQSMKDAGILIDGGLYAILVLVIILIIITFLYFSIIGFIYYTVYSLSNLKPNAVPLGKMLLWLNLISGILFFLISGDPISIFQCFMSVIWLLYLYNSKRVNNTYPIEKRKIKTIDIVFFVILCLIISFILILAYIGTLLLAQ